MTKQEVTLKLLRNAVAAKVEYWDRLRDLEVHLFGDDDDDHERMSEDVDTLAAGLDRPDDAYARITNEHVSYLERVTA